MLNDSIKMSDMENILNESAFNSTHPAGPAGAT